MDTIKEYNQKNRTTVARQSIERINVASKIIARWYEMREAKQKIRPLLRNRTALQYWEDSLKRLNQFKEKPSYKKWWQSNLSSPTPRNKLIGILSKLAANYMRAQAVAQNGYSEKSKKQERIGNSLLKSASIKNKDDKQLVFEMFEAMAKGTVVGYEGWKYDQRNIRKIISQNPATGELKFKEDKINFWNDVWGDIVPIEDIYFGDWQVADIQDMDDIVWRTILTEGRFKTEFKDYQDVELVLPGNIVAQEAEQETIFYQQSDDLDTNEIEIIRYFNQITDEFVILANGVWINPLGKNIVSPLPFNHKKLPFWLAKFEIIDSKFIIGKSIADKFISDIDTEDKLFDNILDRLTMALKAPLIVQGSYTSLTDNFYEPDNVIQMDELTGKAERLNTAEPGQGSFSMLEIIASRINQSSIDPEQLGSSSNRNKTARQVMIEREGAIQLVSLFLKLMEFGLKEKYKQRLANKLQFGFMSKNKKIVLRNELLTNGKIGTLEISFVNRLSPLPNKIIAQDVERVQITSKFLEDFDFDIVMVQQSSLLKTESEEINKEIQFQKVMFNLYPDMFNRETGFQDLIAKFRDKNYQRIFKTQQTQQSMDGLTEMMGGKNMPSTAGGMGNFEQEAVKALEKEKDLKELV